MIFVNIKETDKERLAQLQRGASTKAYKAWRAEVLKRDEYRCQMPSCGRTDRLQVHHIKKQATNRNLKLQIFNGICLCIDCHKLCARKEEKYEIMFLMIALKNMNLLKDTTDGTN